jgi:[acyl-carrier-protein] S-malonyltransferase
MTWVALYPGQGSQAVGMGAELRANFPAARLVWEEADEALGQRLSTLVIEGPPEELTRTENAQPAILTCSVAAWRVLQSEVGLEPAAFAGHSLGEWSALVAAGALGLADAVRLVRARGRFMQEAVAPGDGAMAAVMGLDDEVVSAVCAEVEATGGTVSPANLNGGRQVVIAGEAEAVAEASEALQARGARRVVPLEVSAPFHCALMAPAAERLRPLLDDTRFQPPSAPVVSNVEAAPNSDPERIAGLLVKQVTHTVRWAESVEWLRGEGIVRGVECGHGRVLAGLVRRITPELQVLPCNAPADIGSPALRTPE